MNPIELSVFGCNVRVNCMDSRAASLILANYGSFKGQSKGPQLHYSISRDQTSQGFVITRDGSETLVATDDGEFLFLFEKDLTIELQKLRRDLYFLHGAALEFEGRSFLLVAASGGGKSTTTWGLLHHGFRYLSDELAPVGLERMEVHPYPHALCLKKEPAKPFILPERTLRLSTTMHVPVELLPCDVGREPTSFATVFFLRQRPRSPTPTIEPITKAEAAARLFANALNALAHEGEGLDGAIEIARNTRCFELTIGDLAATCEIVKNTLQDLSGKQITGMSQFGANGEK